MAKTNTTMSAIVSLLALGLASLATPVWAADKPDANKPDTDDPRAAPPDAAKSDAAKPEREKCYGVAKAGKNDCAGPAHACSGQSKQDASGQEYIVVPKGTCERLVNGSLTAK